MDTKDLAYLAGFFDGEGSISLYQQASTSVTLQITIVNRDRRILDWIGKHYGRKPIAHKRYGENHGQTWQLQFCSRKAARLLEAILPYLRVKRKQALLALEFQAKADSYRPGRGRKRPPALQAWKLKALGRMRHLNGLLSNKSRV